MMGWYVVAAVAALAVTVAVVLFLYIMMQGDEQVTVMPQGRSKLICCEADGGRAVFSLSLPVENKGRQDGIILDAFARLLLPQEQFDLACSSARLERKGYTRADDYMEAFVMTPRAQEEFVLTICFTASSGDIKPVLKKIPDVAVDIYYQVVGRTAPHIEKCIISLPLEEFQECLEIKEPSFRQKEVV